MASIQDLIIGLDILKNLIFYLLIGVIIFANKEILNKIKRRLYKRKAIEVELIGPDRKSAIIVCKRKDDSHYEIDNMPFFINSLKAIKKDGVDVFTHVLGNSFAHDFTNNPKEVLKKIITDSKAEKQIKTKRGEIATVKDLTDEFHNIFDEPYRVDARMMQEVLINAQLSSKVLWDELIKLFKNKNLLTIATVMAIGIGICILFTFQTYDRLVHLPVCNLPSNLKV